MNINRLISLVILSLIGLTAFGLFNNNSFLISLGHIFILPMIGIWYGFKRNWATTSIDIATYATYLVGSFSDSVILLGEETGEMLQIIMTLIMHMILIIVFRKEGTRIYADKLKDLPKLVIPVSIIFVFFGTVLIPILPNIIYFIAILYAISEMLLVAHGLFRQVKGKSYIWVATGVILIMLKDVLYCYNFFIYQNKILPLYIIQHSLSGIVYFMIAIGIAINQNKNRVVGNTSIWNFIKNSFKFLFKFNNILHIKIIKVRRTIVGNFHSLWNVFIVKNKIFR
jgi:hypothetical protein